MTDIESGEERHKLGALLRSVVKVMTVSDAPDYEQPWQTAGPTSSFGSGTIVDTTRGPRILTNAHCVENQVFVEVRRYGKAQKFVAEVEAIGHECDLALLTVEDDCFFRGTQPIAIGALPSLGDRVQVCGYPIGGERVSITQGVVSRIDLVQYAQSQRRLLAIQIDAAINCGNSGGPVLNGEELVGVAFQALEGADRVGHIIASPVVEHFLKDVEDGIYDGFPDLGVKTQPLESRAHRRYLGLPDNRDIGVLVSRVVYDSSAWDIVRPGDILIDVDGVPVASDGTVELRGGEVVDFEYVVLQRQVGETIDVRVWRDGEQLDCAVRLREPRYLVAEDRYDVRPSYYVFGGLLFVPVTRDYLKTWGAEWWYHAPHHLMSLYEGGIATPERWQPVALQKVLADRVNQGYHDVEALLIERAQGEQIRSLAHLVEVLEQSRDELVRLESHDGYLMVLDRRQAVARNAQILTRFGVPRDRSPDLDRPAQESETPVAAPEITQQTG